MTTTLDSPFLLSARSTSLLATHLPHLTPPKTTLFCHQHRTRSSPASLKTYLLHHATIRHLLLPLAHLLDHSLLLAAAVLPPEHHAADLERAFLGKARDAVVWYTALADDEMAWLRAVVAHPLHRSAARPQERRDVCPGCLVEQTLHSQSTIRLMLAACRLARHEPSVTPRNSADADTDADAEQRARTLLDLRPSSPASDHTTATTIPSSTSLAHVARRWSRAVTDAVASDPFWSSPSSPSSSCSSDSTTEDNHHQLTSATANINIDVANHERRRASALVDALAVLADQVAHLERVLDEHRAAHPDPAVGVGVDVVGAGAVAEGSAGAGSAAAAQEDENKREQTRRVVDAFVRAWVAGPGAAAQSGAVRCATEAGAAPERGVGVGGAGARGGGGAALRARGAGRLRSITS